MLSVGGVASCLRDVWRNDRPILPGGSVRRMPKSKLSVVGMTCWTGLWLMIVLFVMHNSAMGMRLGRMVGETISKTYHGMKEFDWRGSAGFKVTEAMKVSIGMSMVLGFLLGIGVGFVSGFEPSVLIGVSASMAMGCVFVMSFAILHGVNALRAVAFALFVSVCLPVGFGLGFGFGVLMGVLVGLEDPDDIRDKAKDFIDNFADFLRVVRAFTLEIL